MSKLLPWFAAVSLLLTVGCEDDSTSGGESDGGVSRDGGGGGTDDGGSGDAGAGNIGPALDMPRGLAIDSVNGRLIVADSDAEGILTVDLATGNRTILSDADNGMGRPTETTNAFLFAGSVVVDASNDRALVADSSFYAEVVAVDLATGDRTTVSKDGTRGQGPAINPNGLYLDSAANRIIVVTDNNLVSINTTSGDRTLVSGKDEADPGNGPAGAFQGVAMGGAQQALIVDRSFESIIRVDLTSGNRTTVSGCETNMCGDGVTNGSGPAFGFPIDLAVDTANNQAYVTDADLLAVVLVDLASGDRTIFSRDGERGGGPGFGSIDGIVIDEPNNRLLVGDINQSAIFAVDLSTGDRSVLSQAM